MNSLIVNRLRPNWRLILGVLSAGSVALFIVSWCRRRQRIAPRPQRKYPSPDSRDLAGYVTPDEGLLSSDEETPSFQERANSFELGGAPQTRTRSNHSVSSSRGSTLRSNRSRRRHQPHSSIVSAAPSASIHDEERVPTTADECGRLGLTALSSVISNLEEALGRFKEFQEKYSASSPLDSGSTNLMRQLHALLEQAYVIKEKCKQNVILEADNYIPSTDVSEYGSDSETDSFVSAAELIDLGDLDEFKENIKDQKHLMMYHGALLELEYGSVPCRILRTQMLGLESDTDFLAKLFCVRQAFSELLASPAKRDWMITAGREMTSLLLDKLGYQIDQFELAYQDMLDFLVTADKEMLEQIQEELRPRGVKQVNIFDIVLDFVFLDAFENLACPPPSLVSVINNRWLSNGFKKTALDSVVWTLILAKKKLLKYPEGFVAHYYGICASLSPALAWGFLGPEAENQQVCYMFKDCLLGYVKDIFDFRRVRYTRVEDLAADMFQLAQSRYKTLQNCLEDSSSLTVSLNGAVL